MKLIIDIPEVFYEYCKAQKDAIEIQLAVKNGIPLKDEVMIATLMSLVTDKDYKPNLEGEQE